MEYGGKRLLGKVAVVTASTAGIGLGIAERLGKEGASLVISSRKQAAVDKTVQSLQKQGIKAAGRPCHVGDKQQILDLVQFALDTFGKLDICISNAAVNPAAGDILDMPDGAIDKVLNINIKSAIQLAQAARPHLPKGGSIVFISSYTAYVPVAPIALYAVSKTALLSLTKALAEELGHTGIRVNCIAPGTVPTKFAAALVDDPQAEQASKDRTFMGRLGRPQDIAAAAAYLVSSDADYVTGETLMVTGGMHARL